MIPLRVTEGASTVGKLVSLLPVTGEYLDDLAVVAWRRGPD